MRRASILLAVLAGCASTDEPEGYELGAGAGRLAVAADGTVQLVRDGQARLHFAPDAVELGLVNQISETHSFDPYWLEVEDSLISSEPPPGLRWRKPSAASVEQVGDVVRLDLTYEGSTRAQVELRATAEDRFVAKIVPTSGSPIGFIRLRATVDAEEAFYGLGGAPDHVNHRGFVRPMQMEPDLSIESANNEIHVPVPLLIGTRGWGLFVASDRLGVFDVATEDPRLVEITYGTAEASDQGLEVHLFAPPHPMDVLAHYYAITGAPRRPARWAYGPLIWRDENDDQAQVLDDIRKIRELDLATSGIWIDRPYASAVNTFDFEAEQFPDPEGMLRAAHDAGLRVALWHTPYLEETTRALRAEAEEKGYFPPQAGLRLNRWSDPIDFTNPEAYAWWQSLIRRYTDLGIEGFKLDYGEDIIPGLGGARTAWRFADGSTDRTMHRGFTLLYHQVYAQTLPESGSFLLCRAGRWGDQVNVSVIWPGDLDADLSKFGERRTDRNGDPYTAVGGLPTSLNMDLNLGASGFPFYGADTGGYRHSPPDEETFLRWVEQTALSSVMQVGDSSSQPPWEYTVENGRSEQTLATYRRYARLHMRLFPYAWTYAMQLETTGHPITRALGLAHPEVGVHPQDTYLFGEHLLVAPVLERGARSRSVVLPAGRWRDWWSGAELDSAGGTTVEVEAPLDHLPLFVRAGALVPMLRPDIDTLAPTTTATIVSFANDPGLLWVRAAPPSDAEAHAFALFDGTRVRQRVDGDTLELGYVPGAEFAQGVVFDVYRPGTEVTAGGAPVPRVDDPAAFEAAPVAWTVAEGRLRVKIVRAREITVRVR